MSSAANYTACKTCGEDAAGDGCSLPVDGNANVVGVSFKGAWGAVPCCRSCFELHAAVKLPAGAAVREAAVFEAVLAAHLRATAEVRRRLFVARGDLALIHGLTAETLVDVREHPHTATRRVVTVRA